MSEDRTIVYCLIPRELAPELHQQLRDFYRDETDVEVVVEHRSGDRRGLDDRRQERRGREGEERRKLRARAGRRVSERRARQDVAEPVPLPPFAEQYAERIRFITRREPSTLDVEDIDTARLVTRLQAGESAIFSDLYMRYFDRVYAYLRITLQDDHEAEDAAQEVFIKTLEALPSYERRESPFRAWLFRIVRNCAVTRLRQRQRVRPEAPEELALRGDEVYDDLRVGWLDDRQLVSLVEQLPLAQRQVIVLRYMLDLRSAEIAEVMGRTPDAVRQLHQRAMRFLRGRMSPASAGKAGSGDVRRQPMRRMRHISPVLRSRSYDGAAA